MNVIESIVSWGHGPLWPSYVVIHETANPGATAKNHRDHWKNNDSTYAVHYVGDWTGDVYHCVPDDCMCWQVGNGNPYVLGIELCHATNRADFERVWALGVEWAAWKLKERGWGIDRLLSHYECTQIWGGSDHTDPIGYFEEFGKSWERFKEEVQRALEEEEMSAQEVIDYPIAGPNQVMSLGNRILDIENYMWEATDASGRGKNANMRDRLAFMAEKQEKQQVQLDRIEALLKKLTADKEPVEKAVGLTD